VLAAAPDNVHFVGYLGPEEYRTAIEQADVVVALTTEPTSIVRAGYEAVYARRPLVISNWAPGIDAFPLAAASENEPEALAAAFDVVVIETVGIGQSETEVADIVDTVAVVVQPGSGDVLQFLKSGVMEIPDVLVVTKADLGRIAVRAIGDLRASLRSLGSTDTAVVSVSSVPPPSGIDELVDALDAHRAGLDLGARRLRARRLHALADFIAEHGERGLRGVGGRRDAEKWLAEQDPGLDVPALERALESRAAG